MKFQAAPILVIFLWIIPVVIEGPDDGVCGNGEIWPCTGQQRFGFTEWDDPCPRMCSPSSNGQLIYHLYGHKKFGFQATDFCHSIGGRLMTVKTEDDVNKLRTIVELFNPHTVGFWIGGRKLPDFQNPIYEDYSPLRLSTVRYDNRVHNGSVACLKYCINSAEENDFKFFPCENYSAENAVKMMVCEFLANNTDKRCSNRCLPCADDSCIFNFYEGPFTYEASDKACTERRGKLPFFKDTNDRNRLPKCLYFCPEGNYFTGTNDREKTCITMRGKKEEYNVTYELINQNLCPPDLSFVCENDYVSSDANIGNFSGDVPENEFYYGYPYDCIPYLGSCFLFVQETKNHIDASAHCESLGAENLEDYEEFVNTSWNYVTSFLWLTVSQSENQQLKDDFQFVGDQYQRFYAVKHATASTSNSGDSDKSGGGSSEATKTKSGGESGGDTMETGGPGIMHSASAYADSSGDPIRAFICMFILCTSEPPEPIAAQNIQLANPNSMDGFLTYNCSDGFVPKNESRPTSNASCTEDGWELPSPEELTCITSGCNGLPPEQNAAQNMQLVNRNPTDGYFTYICSEGYVPENQQRPTANATCIDSEWQLPSPEELTCIGCLDDSLLSNNRTDVKLVRVTRQRISLATFKCSEEGMIFPRQRAGAVIDVPCSNQTAFKWNFSKLPGCVKGPVDGQCAVGPTNLTYRMYKRKHTGFEAREYCHILGGRLASITNKEEADFLKDWISNFNNEFWIGGSNVYAVDGKFTLEDQVGWYKDWDSIQSIEPNNTCLVLQNGAELPTSKLCNSTNQTASIICELSGDHFCPLAIINEGGTRIEFYDHRKMPDVYQSAAFCNELGGYLYVPEHPTIVGQLKLIHDVDSSYPFLSKVTPNMTHCVSADVTSVKVPKTTVACSATKAATVCYFIDYNLVQGTIFPKTILRVLSNVEDLMYPDGCVQFFGGCYLFVDGANKTHDEAVKMCINKGGRELVIYTRWQLAFVQLTFNRLKNLTDQQEIVFPVNKKCIKLKKDQWDTEEIAASACLTTSTFICEFQWCFNEPTLSKRPDVRLLNVIRGTIYSAALYECNRPNAHFEKKAIGDPAVLVCSYGIIYQWNVNDLPHCIEECKDDPKRDGVTLVHKMLDRISQATFNCSEEGMVFLGKLAGEVVNISCSLKTSYKWDFAKLPYCIKGKPTSDFHLLPWS